MKDRQSKSHDLVDGEGQQDSDRSDDESAGHGTPNEPGDGQFYPHDQEAKHAYFDYASEKSLSHAESKMMYLRHQLENSQNEQHSQSPLFRSKTFSSMGGSHFNRSRATSSASKVSGKGYALSERGLRLSTDHAPLDSSPEQPIQDQASIDDLDLAEEEPPTSRRQAAASHFVSQIADVSPEMSSIAKNVQKILKLRHKYINISLQDSNSNPKDDPNHWKIYPPPPNPIWDENKNRPKDDQSDLIDAQYQKEPGSPVSRRRKPGTAVGQDFDIQELEPLPDEDTQMDFRLDSSSVYQVFQSNKSEKEGQLVKVPSLRDYYKDMNKIQEISSDGPTKSFAYRQLEILEGKFHLYSLVNAYQETMDCKKVPHRDFYNVRKVDTHVHHSACMNQKHLLRFIKSKMKKCPNETVLYRDGKHLSLEEVFASINLTAYDLSIDTLDMHAHTDSFHRFDKFNLKYNPIGECRLREIFLKTDNYIQGRYLAEITKEVISDLESSKYQFVEWRVSIYGRSIDEWDKLAAWVVDNKLISHNVRWLIQIPRLYSMYKASGQMESFEEIIVNVFQPLYEVTKNPSTHEKLHIFLQRVIGFDSVDDESKIETRLYRKFPQPKEWNTTQNPPYTYWIYHIFANMTSLNVWRKRRGFNTFVLRPHCGEAGDVDHLATAALCTHSISHGLILRKVPLLQYIFYLDQIGIAMSPLSNNALFLAYERNPFLSYFKRGLNVSLSTDDPLQFALTKDALLEEYSVALNIYRLSSVDMCELAQNSVLQSGYEHELKQRWLGPDYRLPGEQGNSVPKSNVPDIRKRFRHDMLTQEHEMLERYVAAADLSLSSTTASTVLPPPTNTNNLQSVGPSASNNIPPSNAGPKSPTLTTHASAPPVLPTSTSTSNTPTPTPTYHSVHHHNWIDDASQPKMFPGIVHERTRRDSIRHGQGGGSSSGGGGGVGELAVLEDEEE